MGDWFMADCTVETSISTGAGDFTLAGAEVGFQRFDDNYAVNDTFPYLIEAIDGSGARTGQFETGLGKYSALNTLNRLAVEYSSAGYGVAETFAAGTKRVSVCATSAALGVSGVMAKKTVNQAGVDWTTMAAVPWTDEVYDNSNSHDPVTNNSRLTVSVNQRAVRLTGQLTLANHTANKFVKAEIRKNGSASYDGYAGQVIQVNSTGPVINLSTDILFVTGGDYFELWLQVETDTSVDIVAAQSWFAMTRVPT